MVLASCGWKGTSSSVSDSGNADPEILAVYKAYAANGGTLSYDDWLASIKGEKGDAGANGSSVYTGMGAPAAALGVNGDSYIDTSSFDYYVKENGVWVKVRLSP